MRQLRRVRRLLARRRLAKRHAPGSVRALGLAAELTEAAADSLRWIEAAIGDRPVGQLAIIVTEQPEAYGAAFAQRYPDARVHVLHHARARDRSPQSGTRRVTVHHTRTVRAMHERLSAIPDLQVLVDAATAKTVKTAMLRHLLYHLRDGGLYIVDRLDTLQDPDLQSAPGMDVWQALSRALEVKVDPALVGGAGLSTDELFLADAVAEVTHDGPLIIVRKAGQHALKRHDPNAEVVLSARHGSGWGRVLDTREAVTEPLGTRPHANMLEDTFRTEMPVPRMSLRAYRDVICAPRQLAVQGDVVLPVSFHHGLRDRLQTRSPLVAPTDKHFTVLDPSLAKAEHRSGAYYHLDSEFPGHFGHFMTEDIAKLWGWQAARAAYPDAKVLLSTMKPGGEPSTIQTTVLAAWGVAASDIVCIDRPVRVDVLIGASQMFYNGIYVHPEMHAIWSRLREALRTPPGDRRPSALRIFVTRDLDALRPCRNAAEVEALFVEHGFEIVRPELLTVTEQVDLFADAEVIAGFGGSGMFNAVYSTRPGRRIVISSDRYLARNEWAIAAAKGDDYHHFFGEAENRPGDTNPRAVFHSPFSFDFNRDGEALRALLRD